MHRAHATLAYLDDKHQDKVREPGHPAAAVDCGKAVLMAKDWAVTVSDHDFTKFKLTPSAVQLCDIPKSLEGSFYSRTLYVTLKEVHSSHLL